MERQAGGDKAKVCVTGQKYAGTVAAGGLVRAVCVAWGGRPGSHSRSGAARRGERPEARNMEMVLAQGNGGERPTEADDACCAVAATLWLAV
jgi:hypothetical protein